jgi:hypothetical protein
MVTSTIAFAVNGSNELDVLFTPPTWIGGGLVNFRGMLSAEIAELGNYAVAIP